ncbi:hypothetical protein [Rhodanobacter sp. Root480]|jgi:hypothetical protein|uniref:hypothetical protein n=1 Tax=Rhodanobacter sp. Root480 TaxID=1736542 RepID=UPI0012E3A3B2|nr:hypothetical protein [Rhodanobacter sp. Root480]
MADGRETRAAIDSETVRGLLLINGGGAVALLAFLSSIIGKPGFSSLSAAIIFATFLFQLGLMTAVIHNRFRRLCSMEYAKKPENRKQCAIFGRTLREPCICHWSTGFMWASILAFVAAGVVVLVSGLCVVNAQTHAVPSKAPTVSGLLSNHSSEADGSAAAQLKR